MKPDRRVDDLFKGLTARERGRLALRAMKAREEDDPQIRLAMPDSQIDSYNRLVALMNGVNSSIGSFVVLLAALSNQQSLRVGWYMTAYLLGLYDDKGRALAFADKIGEALRSDICESVPTLWQEIRAVEVFTIEVAEEFGGEDPMMPELRDTLDAAKASLLDTAETLKAFGVKVRLTNPTAEVLESVRQLGYQELELRSTTRTIWI